MAKQKLDIKIPSVSPEETHRIVRLVDESLKRFHGQIDELEGAIGMYFVGRQMGWRVLVLIHNKRTIKKYEDILGIKIREEFDETGPFTEKSQGYRIAQKLNAFWKAVSGEVSVDHRRDLEKS
jgi:hypothetical protein